MSARLLQDEVVDVLVVGSGAGGMLAAARACDLGLKVIVIEKSDQFGGTSSVSGGAIWIPGNGEIAATDSRQDALRYLQACTGGQVPDAKLLAYLDNGPSVITYLKDKIGLAYRANLYYPDYCQHLPGAAAGGRTMDPDAFDGARLGDTFHELRRKSLSLMLAGRISLTSAEAGQLIHRGAGWKSLVLRLLRNYWLDLGWRRRTPRDRRLTMGNALVGALRLALQQRDIPLLLNTSLEGIVREGGLVTGADVGRFGKTFRISATKGVVLAAGGFEHDPQLRQQFLPQGASADWSLTPVRNNTGDGIRAGTAVGAATEFMDCAWWAPSMRTPDRALPNADIQTGLFLERGFPHSICVNRNGVRFTDEAQSYNDFGIAMLRDQAETGANTPCWMIFDATFRRKYPCGAILPGSVMPDSRLPPEWFGSVLFKAACLRDLAGKIGVNAAGLSATLEKFNRYAVAGKDEDFGRGGNIYDLCFGDQKQKSNPCLGAIERAPFYAVRVDLGDLGTKGGLQVDENANVLDVTGRPIAGLYAIGNTSGSVMAGSYPGAGATLGPAMTFGFIAANHLARSNSAAVQATSSHHPAATPLAATT